jgi:hypothetical protein
VRVEVSKSDGAFEVNLKDSAESKYLVEADFERLPEAARSVDAITLVRDSFLFLLEREPSSSILPRFALSEIARYFPEYFSWLEKRYGSNDAD